MGSLRLTVCTGILAVTALTPSAHAADGASFSDAGTVSVTPASPAPGTDVAVRAVGCSGPEGTAVSTAFVADARLTGNRDALSGDTRVRSSLAPGAYDVKVICADHVVTGTIRVAGRGAGAGRGTGQADGPVRPPTDAASPVAPVHAGGGGTATHFATVATSESGPGAAQAVTGLGLAGIAALAVGLRAHRGRNSRHTR
ncbi:hypothetical protein [Streptomyces sp. MMG1121]|uniref:hypothetical protein n=1 Tax=Streptomyces sp. MMG1121 TaxID=1415544 RepID=UPI0006ADE710|nr:hypothetical protein [Streptomyces sp. MMG1121]KOV59199.1 membrane protein [Streptomyces sp. MMG1121]